MFSFSDDKLPAAELEQLSNQVTGAENVNEVNIIEWFG